MTDLSRLYQDLNKAQYVRWCKETGCIHVWRGHPWIDVYDGSGNHADAYTFRTDPHTLTEWEARAYIDDVVEADNEEEMKV